MRKKTYYETLGVATTATAQQIKRRYRQLVRQHHPDVAQDKEAAKAAFIEITEAYNTLLDENKRLIYDATLEVERFRVRPENSTQRRTASERRSSRPSGRIVEVHRLIQEAQAAFARRQFDAAMAACRQIQLIDDRNVQSYVIMGDVYRVQNDPDSAISMYSIAIQLDPGNLQVKEWLNRLSKRKSSAVGVGERHAVLRTGLSLTGWSMAGFLFLLLLMNPGEPIPWLKMNLEIINTWSTMLIAVLGMTAVITGFVLSANGSLQSLDEALVFQSVPSSPRTSAPIGLFLLLLNFFNFYLAAGAYFVFAVVSESASKSVVAAFAATFLLVVLASLIYTPGSIQVLVFGGNIAFPALLFGWAIGDMFRPGL